MSTILKALRRLESDRNSQVRRPLRQEVAGGAEARRRFPIVWVAGGVFTAGIGIGAAALFLWPAELPGFRSEVPVAAAPELAAAAPPEREPKRLPEPRRRTLGAPAPAEAAARSAAPPPEHDVAVVRQVTPTPLRLQETGPEAKPAAQVPGPGAVRPGAEAMKPKPRRPAPKPAQVAAALVAEPSAPPPQPAARPVPPAPKPEASVGREPAPKSEAKVAPAAEPELAPRPEPAPPVRRRAGVPVILVSRTEWHPTPARRQALIEVEMPDGTETRRVREGDAVGSLLVERIEPSGVVFDYDGVELRHGVGSGR